MQRLLLIAFMLVAVSACSTSIDGTAYQKVKPTFTLESFFDGKVKAWGIVQNRSGDVVQRFTVDIDGKWDGQQLVLDEQFEYGVGEGPTSRVWTITPDGNGGYLGNAGDIANTAKGQPYGNAFNFSYEMDIPVDDSEIRVTFDDWFFAFDDTTLMNRSYLKKFGFVVAEVTIFMQRQD